MLTRLARDNLKLLESGILSDVTIVCKKRVWKAHKVILCARSEWFTKALTGNWKESIDGKITFDDMDPDTMDIVLKYLYSDVISLITEDENLKLEAYVHLWIHADFFQLDLLKYEALEGLRESFVDTACQLWTFRVVKRMLQRSKIGWIHDKAENLELFNDHLIHAVKLAYGNPAAREIQKTLTACVYALSTDIAKGDHLKPCIAQNPDFKADLLAILAGMQFDTEFRETKASDILEIRRLGREWKCEDCDCTLETKPKKTQMVIVNPMSMGKNGWCLDCGREKLESCIEDVVKLM
ncbi:hypothetical protein VMCG_06054 [Cytospora schulzeri]|uniref:BTB domain-containing protein n=1 Tax=Cytospora schulzeri TaxID=448051 RepID=A0A423WGC9_9PEZI|nr:hypothetical protein VMCG_06054 [Valsa malicola]